MDLENFRAYVAELVEKVGSQKAAARQYGVSEQYLSDVLHSTRAPSAAFAAKFGYERRFIYVPIRKRGEIDAS